MNNPRPYGDDPHRGDPYGRRPGPQGPPQRPPQGPPQGPPPGYPPARPAGGGPQSGGGGPYRTPPRQPGGGPEQRRPEPPHERPEPRDPNWGYEENTRVIGKLGYVPPEVRVDEPVGFDSEQLTAQDRAKFRTRKRARKTPVGMKLLFVLGIVLVLGLVGTGIWWLAGSDDPEPESELTYAALESPCAPLDTAALDDLSNEVSPMAESTDQIGSKTEQKCAVRVGNEPGSGADVEVTTVVFTRDAGAKNEFEHVAGQQAEAAADSYSELTGIGQDAFVVSRPWSDETGTADYSLHLWDGNAYLYARIVVYAEVSEDDIAQRARSIAQTYLDNWRG